MKNAGRNGGRRKLRWGGYERRGKEESFWLLLDPLALIPPAIAATNVRGYRRGGKGESISCCRTQSIALTPCESREGA